MSSCLEVRLLGANTVWSAPNDACAAGGLTQVPTTRTVPSSLPITAYYNDSKVGSSSPKSKWAKNLLFSCCLQWMEGCSQSLSETHSGRGAKQELQHRKLQLHTRNKVFIVWVKSDTEAGWPEKLWFLHPWKYSELKWTRSSVIWCTHPCRGWAGWPPELQLHDPYSTMTVLGEGPTQPQGLHLRSSYLALEYHRAKEHWKVRMEKETLSLLIFN